MSPRPVHSARKPTRGRAHRPIPSGTSVAVTVMRAYAYFGLAVAIVLTAIWVIGIPLAGLGIIDDWDNGCGGRSNSACERYHNREANQAAYLEVD